VLLDFCNCSEIFGAPKQCINDLQNITIGNRPAAYILEAEEENITMLHTNS
jgi:hypothetical protein